MSRTRDVVEVVARTLADHPEAVKVTERQHRGQTLVELFMAPGDLGRVIGRQGRTAQAIRTLVSATAELEGLKATLEFRDQEQELPDLLLVGRVARAHGNRGQVIVNPETDFVEDRFKVGQVLHVGTAERAVTRRITEVRFHQGRPIVALEGIAGMDDAEALAGTELWMPASELPPLPPGTFYRHDLVGCEVRDAAGALVGRVTEVSGTLERSLLVVEGARGEVLIPLAAEICVTIDPAARRIVVNPPEGLLDVNEAQHER